jgi:hypothetical protein
MYPTTKANLIARIPPLWDEVWKELTGKCGAVVSGIDGDAAESLKQQLDCHIVGAKFPGIGPTWDFEAWHQNASLFDEVRNRCTMPTSAKAASAYDGWIVQWSDDPAAQKTSWLVVRRTGAVRRNFIQSISDFGCVKATAKGGPIKLHRDYLDSVVSDETGVTAGCPPPAPSPAPVPGPSSPAPAPPSPAPAPGPSNPASVRLTVDNRVTNGSTQMREDTAAYLSTVTRNYCKRDGCMLGGTEVGSGAGLTAECTTLGDRTTNGQDNSAVDDSNPGLYSTTRWYGIRWGDGRFGFISEAWIAAGDRGGKGLRAC